MQVNNETHDYGLKIVLIGDGNVGKTTIKRNYMGQSFNKRYLPTIGADFTMKKIYLAESGEKVIIQLWDIAGQQQWKSIRSAFLKGAQGALVLFDLTRYETFKDCLYWIEELWTLSGHVPICLIGNKVDLLDERVIKKIEPLHFAQELKCEYIETSAKTGEKVNHAFHLLSAYIIDYLKQKNASL